MQGALIETVALALLHFLWEGLLIGLGAALLLRSAAGRSAEQRHLICMAALVCCLLAPLITALVVAPGAAAAVSGILPPLSSMPLASEYLERAASPAHRLASAHASVPMYATVALWLFGVLAVAAYYIAQWIGVRRVRRTAFKFEAPQALAECARCVLRRWQQSAKVAVMLSRAVISPIVVGVWRPVIIFPAALLNRMSAKEFELILLHEIAHIVRRDTWANALQISLEILLFYHPVVHWLSRQARLERECACDDFAVKASGTPYEYARALTALAFAPVTPFSLGASGGELLHRLRHLGGQSVQAEAFPGSSAHMLLLAVLLACLLLARPPSLEQYASSFGSPASASRALSAARRELPPPTIATPSRPLPETAESGLSQPVGRAGDATSTRLAIREPDAPASLAVPQAQQSAQAEERTAELPRPAPVALAQPAAGDPDSRPAPASTEPPAANPRTQPQSAEAARAPVLTPIYDPAPEYPLQARLGGVQGSVVVIVRVGTDGHPTGLTIVKATPQGVFEGAVRRALMRWRYKVEDGDPSHLSAAYRLTFSLAGVSSSPASVCANATASRTCEGS
jgi:TonB family protein